MNDATLINGATNRTQIYGGRHPADKRMIGNVEHPTARVNKLTGEVEYMTRSGMTVNSMLSKYEWEEVDNMTIAPSSYPLKFIPLLRSKGLVKKLGGIGSLISTWYAASDITGASVNMTGQGNADNDLPDMAQSGVPIPVIFKPYTIDARQLEASRRSGDGLDLTALGATLRVINEKAEDLIVNGATTKLNGFSLYGVRTHPGRLTSTAAGDFGTIANILPTINSMVSTLQSNLFYGPYSLFLSQDQWLEINSQYYGADSNITPLSRIEQNKLIASVDFLPASVLASGELLMIQMTSDVIDMAEALPIQVREWTSGDGWQTNFKVLTVMAPRIKARYDAKVGIAHFTGA